MLEITAKETIALVIALGTMIVIVCAIFQRYKANKGIGWQFIRFSAILLALPLAAVLALTGTLDASSATILAGALGYAFGKSAADE